MRVGMAFSKFVDCRRRVDGGKVGIGFYMCLCGWWRQVVVGSRVGSNSMVMAWDGYGGLGVCSLR